MILGLSSVAGSKTADISNQKKPAVFLDRDGVLNELVLHPELGVIDSPLNEDEVKIVKGAAEALLKLRRAGYLLVVVSNQPVIAKGKVSEELFNKIDAAFRLRLGVPLDGVYYCLHHPEAKLAQYKQICECRKPKPGLILRASADLNIDLFSSFLVGDALSDMQAARSAGCTPILLGSIKTDWAKFVNEGNAPAAQAPDWAGVTDIILSWHK